MTNSDIIRIVKGAAKEVNWKVVGPNKSGLYRLISAQEDIKFEQYKPDKIENLAAEINAHRKRLRTRAVRRQSDYVWPRTTPAYWKNRRRRSLLYFLMHGQGEFEGY